MKKIVMTLLFIVFVLYGLSKAQGFSYDEEDETIWGYTNTEINYSMNKQNNFKLCLFNYDKAWFETELMSVSIITAADHRRRVSSNTLFTMLSFAALWCAADSKMDAILLIPTSVVLITPIVLGNAKVYAPLSKKHLWMGGGLNTDYYLFYEKSPVIFTEILFGFKIGVKKIKTYVDCRFPINNSYLKKNEPYLNIGFVLDSSIIEKDAIRYGK
jgi:hypothetical protein